MFKKAVMVLYISVSVLVSDITFAKCPIEWYKIRGQCLSENSVPIEKAVISIFFDDYNEGYTVFSTEKGEYEITYYYHTYKGRSLFGDVCGRKPVSMTIFVYASDYYSMKTVFSINRTEIEEGNVIHFPPIILHKISPLMLQLIRDQEKR